ncbi:MAG: TetR/AcrR family transcriptional regulator [Anaerolineaceae bacterium]|jgi:AcrR family transcriptional regulator
MPRQSKEKSEETRARIVEAAYDLFLAQGFAATSMRQIVQRAGVTMGGVYNHFPSKQELWSAVFIEKTPFREILATLQAAQGDTIEEFILDAARRTVQGLGERKELLNLMFIELVEFKAKDLPMLLETISPEVLPIFAQITQKPGMRPISAESFITSFLSFFFAYYLTEQLFTSVDSDLLGKGLLESFVDIFLYGIIDTSKHMRLP